MLSASAVRQLWGNGATAIGRHVRTSLGRETATDLEVVGVVSDVRLRGVTGDLAAEMYMPIAQNPPYGGVGIVIDTAGNPAGLIPAAQAALREVDSDLPLYGVTLVRDLRARFMATQRLTLALTAAFAGITLVLCAIGVYGALSQVVAQQTREIGIRMALGAQRGRLRRSFVLSGLRPAIGGVVLGLVVSGLASRLIARFVPALDAPSLGAVAADALILLGVAFLAAWFPARRASAVNPISALRAE
jgi:predicted lysophospholipase L1 biosynthesis ABC-type transport system permease subunit